MNGPLVVGYDGSDCAKAALAQAAALANRLDQSVVVGFAADAGALSGEMSDHRNAVRERGERMVAEAVDLVGDQATVTTAVVPAAPADALIQLAEAHGASMIVVGTHGESPLMGALLGSTPYKLVHRSPVPVLVVPDPVP